MGFSGMDRYKPMGNFFDPLFWRVDCDFAIRAVLFESHRVVGKLSCAVRPVRLDV